MPGSNPDRWLGWGIGCRWAISFKPQSAARLALCFEVVVVVEVSVDS